MEKANEITIRTDIRPGDIGLITYLHGVLYKDEFKHGISFESIVNRWLSNDMTWCFKRTYGAIPC